MVQRLGDKNIFGKVIQKWIVSSYENRALYVEKFSGEWLENKIKVGVFKGEN